MDAGVSSTCVCVCSLRVHSHACTPPSVRCERGRERETVREGEERGALEFLSVSQEHGPERETRLSVCIVHL